jgi:Ca-activated chloride channel homolog
VQFDSPLFLLLLLALPPLVYLRLAKWKTPGLRFSSVAAARSLPRTWRTRLRHLPLALRVAAAVLAVIAVARPRQGIQEVREVREGIAIQMVLDRSGSMGTEMEHDGKKLTRLDAVKRVFAEFVTGNGRSLRGRPNDLVGMVVFARYADTICPLTLTHGATLQFLDTVHLVDNQAEDGTAIGDAIALAAARLQTATADAEGSGYRVTGKVIILLTDGIHNAGKRTPAEAARLAAGWGIRVHAIGIGGGPEYATLRTPLRTVTIPGSVQVDRATLEEVAALSGGIYRDASDADSLRAVYGEIDRLEKSAIEEVRYADYRELFVPFALAALLLVAAEALLRSLVWRGLP